MTDIEAFILAEKVLNEELFEKLLAGLKNKSILRDNRLEQAFRHIRIEDFIPPPNSSTKEEIDLYRYRLKSFYSGIPVDLSPTFSGFSILSPQTLGILVQLLNVGYESEILVIGSNLGILSSLIVEMNERVTVTILETDSEVISYVSTNLNRSQYKDRINWVSGVPINSLEGLGKKFDRIIVPFNLPKLPQSYLESLKDEGLIIFALEFGTIGQNLYRIKKMTKEEPTIENWGQIDFPDMTPFEEQNGIQVFSIEETKSGQVRSLEEEFVARFTSFKEMFQKHTNFSISHLYAFQLNRDLLDLTKIAEIPMEEIETKAIRAPLPLDIKNFLAGYLHIEEIKGGKDFEAIFFPVPNLGMITTISKIVFQVDEEARIHLLKLLSFPSEAKDYSKNVPEIKGNSLYFELSIIFIISASGSILSNFEIAPMNIAWSVDYFQGSNLDTLRRFFDFFQPANCIKTVLENLLQQIVHNKEISIPLKHYLVENVSYRDYSVDTVRFGENLPNEVLTIPVEAKKYDEYSRVIQNQIKASIFDIQLLENYNCRILANRDFVFLVLGEQNPRIFQDLTFTSTIAYLRILSDFVYILHTTNKITRMLQDGLSLLREIMEENLFSQLIHKRSNRFEEVKTLELEILQRFYNLDINFLVENYRKISRLAARFSREIDSELLQAGFEEMTKKFMETVDIVKYIQNLRGMLKSLKTSYSDVNELISKKQQKLMSLLLFAMTIIQAFIAITNFISR